MKSFLEFAPALKIGKKIKNEIVDLSLASEKVNDEIAQNVGLLNSGMQEIIRYLLSLDEGNRLVIAKLLLNDLGD